ncbi:hypothetical protein, conserved [Trypanosoma brucei gambiense DAL972]|uniref:Cyclic nucleotide-binding domain-containing protein n=1 Tax=Trypanosoma brucei gambiense (strain MHOM/CI/86/DAL972) TaxID=679716 RepID=C9ZLL1_TRYB9|nr:hypothetical protein, conserved [Trypanosoma brucei gambiense DAL972]CBH10220.1 hypothetical protein, conserved [Trypanosoma brucei gambiense DAL972]|eukprot:XP_011772510.1 hypothetical protein, conserved [Trypanosoma brucei gambiense DAL972]
MGIQGDLALAVEGARNGAASFDDSLRATTDERGSCSIEADRLLFVNTALRAIPGRTLCTFFAPIMGVKRNLLNRRRLTEQHMLSDPVKAERLYKDAIRILTKTLVDASAEVFDSAAPIDEKELAAALRGKLVPQCYEPGAVLAYPGEFPEVMFVHVVLSGSVQVVHYQLQSRRMGFSEGSRRQYFVSNEVLRLSGALGLQPELFKLINAAPEPLSDGASDMASLSNVSTTATRTMRRVSRMMGQPTLQAIRTELNRAPYVLSAQEALGFEPFRLTTVTAEATGPSGRGGESSPDSRIIQTMRIRARDLHKALVQMALSHAGKQRTATSPTASSRHTSALMECISVARVKCICRHYPLNEILMRQSWLLQDTPAYTIRALVTQLAPRSYFPGEIILCPHSTNRHLSFLRRGIMTIEEVPPPDPSRPNACQCGSLSGGNVLQEVPQGASFGELSVLFGEPRQFVLRAKTPCDVWSLSRQSFAATIRRDDALRASLLSKAAALRMRWLGEQRYTTVLADKLRECCELFRHASDSFIRLIQERVEPVVYPPGRLLTSTSARCMEMLIITHGKVSSIVDGVAEYGPGSVIGEPTIILHRWPLGLVSKSMVEGWKLTRHQLRDALERVEVLRQHSGEVAGHVQQLMQSIFAPPVPPCGVDAVGRSRMPLVGPPPYGNTYFEYAEWLAEGQLKALCFKHREYVNWKDISYSTLSGQGKKKRGKVFKLSETFDVPTVGDHRSSLPALKPVTKPHAPKHKRKEQPRKIRFASAGSTFPFHINPVIGRQLVAHPNSAKQPVAVPFEADPFLAKQRALTSAFVEKTFNGPLPQLQQMTNLLENRDKLMKVEAKQHKLNDSKQERMNVIDLTESGGLAPVHIFLHGSNPRVHITVEEAVAVGYVLQFPDTKRIQSCVSNIDSDVTLGLPQHRQRRRDMAFIPNDRHPRYCFLFAASQLGERSAEEVLLYEAAVQEAESKERAQHLTALLVAQLPEKHRPSAEQHAAIPDAENTATGEWRGVSMPVTSLNPTVPGNAVSSRRRSSSPQVKDATGETFLQHLRDSPEQAMSKMRMKFQVSANAVEEVDGSKIIATRASGDVTPLAVSGAEGSDQKFDLLDRLRSATAPVEGTNEGGAGELPPRRPNADPDEKSDSGTHSEGEHTMEKFFKKEETPVFVDGYGELSTVQSKSTVEVAATQPTVPPTARGEPSENWFTDSPPIPGASNTTCAWMPQNFTMPTVSEATATMRLIQSDVDGLNAVAQEQRRERLQRRNIPGAGVFDPTASNVTSLESQRLVDEWVAEYRGHSRDPMCPAQIPPLLLAEAGTDYLAEEFRHTRRQHVVAVKEAQGVEIWRGEVDARARREGKNRQDSNSPGGGKSVLAVIGGTKLGFPAKPLRNPTANMSAEEYERWVSERDALFASADGRQ